MPTAILNQFINGNTDAILNDGLIETQIVGANTTVVELQSTSNSATSALLFGSFTFDGGGNLTGGTIESFQIGYDPDDTGTPFLILSGTSPDAGGLNIDALVFYQAVLDAQNGDYGPFQAIVASFDIEFDASTTGAGVQFSAGPGDDVLRGGSGGDDFYGQPGDDIIQGGFGDDNLFGGDGNDNLFGDDGDDHLIGGEGDDYLVGGGGTDTAVFSGNFADYTINWQYNIVTDDVGFDGTDTLDSIEYLQFADGIVSWNSLAPETTLSGNAFNLDGDMAADLVIQNAAGHTFLLLDGGDGGRVDLGGAGQGWQLIGNVNGDYTGGDEILFENANGHSFIYLNGTDTRLDSLAPATNMDFLVMSDLDGNGTVDGVLQNAAGHTFALLDTTRIDLGGAGLGWNAVANADFDGDGNDDVVFQNASGHTFIYAEGMTARTELGGAGQNWDIKAFGDFDGDGRDSLLIERNGGILLVDEDGISHLGGSPLNPLSVAAVADLNGDGAMEIVLANQAGHHFSLADDGQVRTEIGGAGQNWQVEAVADTKGDGNDDLVIRNGSDYFFVLNDGAAAGHEGLGVFNGADFIGTADIDGSGGSDLVLQRGSGGVFAAQDGSASFINFGGDGQGWDVLQLADFDGDLSDDLLIQNGAGHGFLLTDTGAGRVDFHGSSGGGWNFLSPVDPFETDHSNLLL